MNLKKEKFTILINKDFQLKRIKEINDEKEIEKLNKENLFSINLNSNQKHFCLFLQVKFTQ